MTFHIPVLWKVMGSTHCWGLRKFVFWVFRRENTSPLFTLYPSHQSIYHLTCTMFSNKWQFKGMSTVVQNIEIISQKRQSHELWSISPTLFSLKTAKFAEPELLLLLSFLLFSITFIRSDLYSYLETYCSIFIRLDKHEMYTVDTLFSLFPVISSQRLITRTFINFP